MTTFKGSDYGNIDAACDALVSDFAVAGGNPPATQAEKMLPEASILAPCVARDYAEDDPTVKAWATTANLEAAIERWKDAQ